MPVNVPPTATGKRRFRLAVETDPHMLVNYCCGLNYHIDEPPIELKPDDAYPDWLWNLRLGPKPKSWELEKGTKEYYLALAEEGKGLNELIRQKKAKPTKVLSKPMLERMEYKHFKRFAALAHLEDDAGLDPKSMETDWWSCTRLYVKKRKYYLPVNENKVLYMDKIPGNMSIKNYYVDEESTFKPKPRKVEPRGPIVLDPILDSKRRYLHASN